MRLGYIGLGVMGGPLARRLMQTHKLCVFDLDPARIADFAADGAVPAASPGELAAECDLVFTCLPTSNEVRAVLFGAGGVAATLPKGGIVADMTTGDPAATRAMAAEMAERGLTLIDAPVSGGPHGATAGTIALMLGAPDDVFARVKPVFEAISPNVFHCGDVGAGHTMKLVNNMIAASVRTVTFEAVTMGVKSGLALDRIVEVVNKGTGRSYTSEVMLPRLLDGSVKANFQVGLMVKDVSLATQCGADAGAPMPVCGLVRETLRAAMVEHGYQADVNMLIRSMERAAKVKVVPD